MSKLILIKHAAPEVVPGVPSEQWRLSEQGRAACTRLAEALRPHAPSVIVASEEPKASETGELVARVLGVPFYAAPGLHEHDRGNVPHLRSGEFISMVEVFFRRPNQLVLGRETATGALKRFRNALGDVVEQHGTEGADVAVVSHGTVIALLLEQAGGGNGFEVWRRMKLPSFAVFRLPEMSVEQVVDSIP